MDSVLQKYIASSGYCSRRQAEKLISEGLIKVNGKIAHLGERVKPGDEIFVGRLRLEEKKDKIYIKLNKPVGYTCTNRDFAGEKNVFDLVTIKERLFVVGRLDKNSHGLVLLTNDGALTEKLTHPRYEDEKIYEVILNKVIDIDGTLNKFKNGVDIGVEDGIVRVKKIKYLDDKKFELVLTQGKKRQIRRMFAVLGMGVMDLKRVGIASLRLDDLKEGQWKFLTKEEIFKLNK